MMMSAMINALLGGAIIGLASALFILYNGRIAGISGIVGGLFKYVKSDYLWRVCFVVGLLISPVIASFFLDIPQIVVRATWIKVAIAGVLVGFFTRFGSGCTSGHGVCGLSRFSIRSLVATGVFMGSAIITVMVSRFFGGF
jgi:uncharacterized membrane protein YedE/YeeE